MDLRYFDEVAELVGVLGLKISRGGEELAYKTWDEECRRNLYSASKSVTALAVGFAEQEGLLSLQERLTDAFSDDLPEKVSDHLRAATVRDLLTMCLGQPEAQLMGAQRPLYGQQDWVRLSLSFPFSDVPATRFVYSNVGPYLAGELVQRRAGCSLVDYLMPRLFLPLGIMRPTWECDPLGNTFGASGLFLTLSELHKIGLFCLQRGVWEGRRRLDEQWLEECSRRQSDAPYGYLFWIGKNDSFRLDGKYGQLSVIFPKKEAVITVVSECRKPEILHRAIYEDLYARLE